MPEVLQDAARGVQAVARRVGARSTATATASLAAGERLIDAVAAAVDGPEARAATCTPSSASSTAAPPGGAQAPQRAQGDCRRGGRGGAPAAGRRSSSEDEAPAPRSGRARGARRPRREAEEEDHRARGPCRRRTCPQEERDRNSSGARATSAERGLDVSAERSGESRGQLVVPAARREGAHQGPGAQRRLLRRREDLWVAATAHDPADGRRRRGSARAEEEEEEDGEPAPRARPASSSDDDDDDEAWRPRARSRALERARECPERCRTRRARGAEGPEAGSHIMAPDYIPGEGGGGVRRRVAQQRGRTGCVALVLTPPQATAEPRHLHADDREAPAFIRADGLREVPRRRWREAARIGRGGARRRRTRRRGSTRTR